MASKPIIDADISRAKCTPKKGSIIISRSNTPDLVGASAYIEDNYPSRYLPDKLWQTVPQKNVEFCMKWLSYVLSSPEVRHKLSNLATGSSNSMKNITKDELLSIPILIPKYLEQRKIAEILRTWDEAIERVDSLIAHYKNLYLALRDDLIDWSSKEKTPLGCVISLVSRPIPKPDRSYTAASIRSHGKGAYSREVKDPSSVDMDTLYEIHEGDLVVNITFAWEGAIALVDSNQHGCLVSHRFPTYQPDSDKINPHYLRHAVRTSRFTYLLKTISPGGAGRNRVLNKTDFSELKIPYPDMANQNKIADILDGIEDILQRKTKHRDRLAIQKRGLMQKLLTGQWRVSTGSETPHKLTDLQEIANA